MIISGEDSILMKSVGGKSVGCVGSTAANTSANTSANTGANTGATGPPTGMTLSSEPQNLIHDLLESLTTVKDDAEPAPGSAVGSGAATTTPTEERSAATHNTRRQVHLSRSSSANDMVVQETDEQVRNVNANYFVIVFKICSRDIGI